MAPSDKDRDFRLAAGFSSDELKQQEYRSLCFWASLTSVGLGVLFVASLLFSAALPVLAAAVLARVIMAIAKAYYRQVYRVR